MLMQKHKIFQLLSTIPAKDIKKLKYFINSPYYNTNKNISLLFESIAKYYPAFTNKKLQKQFLYKSVYGAVPYKDSTMRNLLSKLLALIEDFISIENFNENKFLRGNLLLEELINKNQKELVIKNLRKLKNKFKSSKAIDYDYMIDLYKLEKNKFNFGVLNDTITNKNKVYSQIRQLNNSAIYLTIYYITEIICEYLNVFFYHEKYNATNSAGFIPVILDCLDLKKVQLYIKNNNEYDFIFEIYIALYYTVLMHTEDSYYDTYKNLITKYSPKLSPDEISFHYSVLINLCIIKEKSRVHKKCYSQELLDLYEMVLEKEYYKNKKMKHLPESLFRDILFLQIRMKRPDLMSILIDHHCDKINPKQKENMKNFANAFYYYETNNFPEAMEYCNKIKPDYFIYKYDIKNLMLKIYYELGFYEAALNIIHSYKESLRKDEFLIDARKVRFKNFINFLQKIILIKINNKSGEIDYVRSKLNKLEDVSFKNWLLNKVVELR